jgi:predicted nuclease with TOPRIM domain
VDAGAIGLVSAAATVASAAIGGGVLFLTTRSNQRRAIVAEERRDDAERRAAEADRLNEELGRWTNYCGELREDIARLRGELTDARDGEQSQRDRAHRLQERLDAKTRDLEVAERLIERLKVRLGEE